MNVQGIDKPSQIHADCVTLNRCLSKKEKEKKINLLTCCYDFREKCNISQPVLNFPLKILGCFELNIGLVEKMRKD